MISLVNSEDFFSRDYGEKFYENRHRPVLVAVDLQTPANIGGLIRLAGNIGCQKVVFVGEPENFSHKKVKRAAKNAFGRIPIVVSGRETWISHIPEDYRIVALETASGATDIYSSTLPDKIALVVGSERYGLDDRILKACNSAIYIPMPGSTLSLNVVQAAGVALFEWFRQQTRF